MKARFLWIIPPALLLLVAVFGVVAFLFITRRPFPNTRGSEQVEGITASVEIVRDANGVPHIYAETSRDMYFAQGYAHAQDRFWQMEFWRRLGAGRLSEYFGESTVGVDRFMRTMGFARIAAAEYETLPPGPRGALDAYAAGVNAYISEGAPGQLGLEFTLLGLQGVELEIEPWEPTNTMTWLKIMAYDLGGNLQDELNRLDLLRLVGREKAADFYPDRELLDLPPITRFAELRESLGDLAAAPSSAAAAAAAAGLSAGPEPTPAVTTPPAPKAASLVTPANGAPATLPSFNKLIGGIDPGAPLALGKGGNVGSNSWVISGELSETGMPILAADLHLGVQMPSIWYEVVLKAESDDLGGSGEPLSLGGFSFAGVPGIVLGHNDRVAWGLTNVNPDVQDLYLERINPEEPNEYLVGDDWRPMELRVEEIQVHGKREPVRHVVRSTRNGPIVSDAEGPQNERSGFGLDAPSRAPDSPRLTELSLKWTALQENRTFEAVFVMNRARDFESFLDGAARWDIPSQNLVYADVDGNIGYQTPGLIPIRRRGDGSYPVPGWDDAYQWDGYIPFDELPRVYNPSKGYIATANQPVAPAEYPHHITADFAYGHRGARISEMIEEGEGNLGIEEMAAIQGDSASLPARDLLPPVLAVQPAPVTIGEEEATAEEIAAFQESLAGWDRVMAVDSAGAAAYALMFQALLEETVRDELPDPQWSRSRLLKNTSRINAFFQVIIADPENRWWDDVTTLNSAETRDDVVLRALGRAVVEGRELLGDDQAIWRWGDLHTVTFRNQTFGESGIGVIEAIFNRGPFEVPSGLDQVWSADYDIADPFETVNLASMRQLIDLENLDNSRMMHTTGQSGHPYHRHYDDFIESWRSVEFHPHLWSREVLEEEKTRRLLLEPPGE